MGLQSEALILEEKRRMVAERIREVAPHIDTLARMLDETKVDLILIALTGARLHPSTT